MTAACGPATSDRRPHPWWRLLLSPWSVVLLVSLHLHCTGGRRSPWGVVLLRPPTPRSVVVGGRRQCCSDAPLLVSPPRAEPSLPPPHCRELSIVAISHHDQPLSSRTKDHQGKATLFEWKRLVVLVVLVVQRIHNTACLSRRVPTMHLITWQNTWEQAPGVPATSSPP